MGALRDVVERALRDLPGQDQQASQFRQKNLQESWQPETVAYLRAWQAGHASGDCPLPDLFLRTQRNLPTLTIGQFHDGLRRLYEQQQIYLHPWTGPLYEIPEPACAMLVGHEIAYYASGR
jgi:hypothetical protein